MLFLAGVGEFCNNTANIWKTLGWVVLILKIVIPLILIILGMLDLGKAVVASKEDEINKSVQTLARRFVAAVIIFFIPTIVSAIFNLVLGIDMGKDTVNNCVQCVTNVTGNQCNDNGAVKINTGWE